MFWLPVAPLIPSGILKGGNFVVVDGFEVDGNPALGANGSGICFGTDNLTLAMTGTATARSASHHLWFLNNIVHHCAQSGFQINGKEFYYVIHNSAYHNSWYSGFNGSGISMWMPQCIQARGANCFTSAVAGEPSSGWNYTYAGNDLLNNQPAAWAPFHTVVAWNVLWKNRVTNASGLACNSNAQTDGNGIIMDTGFDQFTFNTLKYLQQSLVMNNVAYYNGGRGVHSFRYSNATYANNSVYDNVTDTCIDKDAWNPGDLTRQGSGSPSGDSSGNTLINNLSLAVQGPFGYTASLPNGPNHCALTAYGPGDTATYNNNVLSTEETATTPVNLVHVCLGDNEAQSTVFNCTNNKCSTDPKYVDTTAGVAGDVNGNPVGGTWIPGHHNLALASMKAGAKKHSRWLGCPLEAWCWSAGRLRRKSESFCASFGPGDHAKGLLMLRPLVIRRPWIWTGGQTMMAARRSRRGHEKNCAKSQECISRAAKRATYLGFIWRNLG